MRPSAVELIRGIESSFEEYIAPELEHPLALSAATGIRVLLKHLELRVETEAPWLYEDSEEKKALFQELARCLRQGLAGKSAPTLEALASELETAATREYRSPGAFPTLPALASENAELREVLDRTIRVLHAQRSVLDSETYDDLKRHIHAQLRRELDRENVCIEQAFTGALF